MTRALLYIAGGLVAGFAFGYVTGADDMAREVERNRSYTWGTS